MNPDTIVALATPPGQGALGVIRLSGPSALDVAQRLAPRVDLSDMASHTLRLITLRDGAGLPLDQAVLSLFRAPHSYTREDVVELSCHGSPYILAQVLHALLDAGARMAEPGEFTRRAFLNGAMDLAQAEAVADLIAAQSAAAHRTALRQLRGGYSDALSELREQLTHIAALLELELDFADEDVHFADRTQLRALTDALLERITRLLAGFRAGAALRTGLPLVIAGKPNAGKSTLLNALLHEDRAIVSPVAGTTRDLLEDQFYLEGRLFRIIDTAGLRTADDEIEAEGVRRTQRALEQAAVVCWVYDLSNEAPDAAAAFFRSQDAAPADAARIIVANKRDAAPDVPLPDGHLGVSAREGDNLDALRAALAAAYDAQIPDDTLVTNARHAAALSAARDAVQDLRAAMAAGVGSELLALDVRRALDRTGEITGAVSSDDVLGAIFAQFCIGK